MYEYFRKSNFPISSFLLELILHIFPYLFFFFNFCILSTIIIIIIFFLQIMYCEKENCSFNTEFIATFPKKNMNKIWHCP